MSRRVTRSRLLTLLAVTLFWISRRHLRVVFLLALEPLIFAFGDRSFELSNQRDGFDITFSKYPIIHDLNAVNDTSYPVPPIVHHILLGTKTMRPGWSEAGEACKIYHPGYRFEFWDDDRAMNFVGQEYPELLPMWQGYKHIIQRADSLRYMILYKYGGIFLDLDLHCRRSLDPLRRFDFVAAAAYPAGISNGFMMVKPKSPFMRRLVRSLRRYNLSWFGLPYVTVSFSTGCHYLS